VTCSKYLEPSIEDRQLGRCWVADNPFVGWWLKFGRGRSVRYTVACRPLVPYQIDRWHSEEYWRSQDRAWLPRLLWIVDTALAYNIFDDYTFWDAMSNGDNRNKEPIRGRVLG
jgi:hypothetical protein